MYISYEDWKNVYGGKDICESNDRKLNLKNAIDPILGDLLESVFSVVPAPDNTVQSKQGFFNKNGWFLMAFLKAKILT